MSPTERSDPYDVATLPYRVAVLCYVYDTDGRLLLLHRRKEPNVDMYSPIGGKLEVGTGESPHACAVREIREEIELSLRPDEVRLVGLVSETAYQGNHHWLIFLFEVTRPVRPEEIHRAEFEEGRLEWHDVERVAALPIPETDRLVMWPNVRRHRGGFFSVHIDCTVKPFRWTLLESWMPRERAGGSPPRNAAAPADSHP